MCKALKNLKKIIWRAIAILFLLLIFAVLLFIKKYPSICEWYTTTVSRAYQTGLGTLIAPIPFSIMEVLALICIGLALFFVISAIVLFCKLKPLKAVVRLLNVVLMGSFILVLYFGTSELAYNREKLEINYYSEKVEKTDFCNIISYFINDINDCCSSLEFREDGEVVNPYSTKELSDLCALEYERIQDNEYFTPFTTTCKGMLSSFLYREFHITGVTFSPTTEANVNTLNVEAGKPFTFLHELAHTKGVMRENDAQLVALCLSLTSSNKFIRFSAYYYSFGSFISLARHTGVEGDYANLVSTIDPHFLQYGTYANNYWSKYHLLDDFAEWWNNLYLKFSGVEEGTESYNDPPAIVTPTEITFSNYQKIYFRVFYGGDLL